MINFAKKIFTSRRQWKLDQVSPVMLNSVDVAQTHVTIPITGHAREGRNIDPRTLVNNPDEVVKQFEVHFTKNVEKFRARHPDDDLAEVVLEASTQTITDTKNWLQAARNAGHLDDAQIRDAIANFKSYHDNQNPNTARIKELKNPD